MAMTAGDAAPDRAAATEPDPALPEDVAGRPIATKRGRAGRAGLLVLVLLIAALAAVLSSPFWAPRVAPLLPWGRASWASTAQLAAVAARIDAVERRPTTPGGDVDALKAAEQALSGRVARLEQAAGAVEAERQHLADMRTALDRLKEQVEALAAQRAGMSAAAQRLQLRMARFESVEAAISGRVAALEHQARAAEDAKGGDAAALLAFLPLRAAIESGRPFAAAFDAFRALAHDRPELIAAAEPLAAAAAGGVPSRAALQAQLAQLGDRLARPKPPPAANGWGAQALRRLQNLVTIRRIGEPTADPSQAAVAAAARALEAGDADAAAKALGRLSDGDAVAAAPLVRQLQQRAAAEAALAQIEQVLTARLAGSPPAKPPPVPKKPGAPS